MFWKLPGNVNAGWVVLIWRKPLLLHGSGGASGKELIEVFNLPVSFTKLYLPFERDHKIWTLPLSPATAPATTGGETL